MDCLLHTRQRLAHTEILKSRPGRHKWDPSRHHCLYLGPVEARLFSTHSSICTHSSPGSPWNPVLQRQELTRTGCNALSIGATLLTDAWIIIIFTSRPVYPVDMHTEILAWSIGTSPHFLRNASTYLSTVSTPLMQLWFRAIR